MAAGGETEFLNAAAVYLGATVVAVPLFKQLKLGSVIGYLIAGVLIGPHALELISDADAALSVAEFGVVLLLFVIGLELKPATLWRLRYEVFGLGAAQVVFTAVLIGALASLTGLFGLNLGWREALVAGAGLALSSTAFAIQVLREKGDLGTPYGQRSFAVLLFQDLAIVPLIAMVGILAPAEGNGDPIWFATLKALAAIGAVYFVGRYALKPIFSLIAQAHAEEVFAAAALLVVVAAALAMNAAGLSMALGAFLAGVLLAESEYRHQIETDIEPFRALLMGLFFIAVGMTLDLSVFSEYLGLIMLSVVVLAVVKVGVLYLLALRMGSSSGEALRIAAVLSQGGEFGFVLFAQAADSGLMGPANASILTAVVTISMALTPFLVFGAEWLERRGVPEDEMEGLRRLEDAPEAERKSPIIVAGFGRTGQVIARILRQRGYELTLIDNNPRRIRFAETFGSIVFFGDARRLDTLATAGGDEARAIFLCIDDRDGARLAVERIRTRFPNMKIFASSYDRFSMLEMETAGAHVIERQCFEGAVSLARKALEEFGDAEIIEDLLEEFRKADEKLLRYQARFGAHEGIKKLREGFSLEKEQ
ncbi:MAG: monovalent cation:proton antiporter-2 (CPA2) family protein [Pseudomonadota bacterium]